MIGIKGFQGGLYIMEPNVIKVIQSTGEVDDYKDYVVNKSLMSERGMGFTACQPSLVEIEINNETGKPVKAIKMGIDPISVPTKIAQ